MTLRTAYLAGAAAALAKFASSLGADYGIAPRGTAQVHGTSIRPYRAGGPPSAAAIDRTFDTFGDDRKVTGTGTETIG